MKFVFKTDVGKKRKNNEDSVYVKKYDEDTFFYIVADGLGGYESGEIASYMLTKIMSSYIDEKIDVLKKLDEADVKKCLIDSLELANKTIFDLEKTDPKYKGMGTTVVAVLKINSKIYYVSIGDSRIYHIDSLISKITQITIDDTYVNELIKTNVIKKEEAFDHPQKHVLTKAVGIVKNINVKVNLLDENLKGYLILCTDGLNNMIKEEDLLKIFRENKFNNLAEKLVKIANENGGTDNITVIVVEL